MITEQEIKQFDAQAQAPFDSKAFNAAFKRRFDKVRAWTTYEDLSIQIGLSHTLLNSIYHDKKTVYNVQTVVKVCGWLGMTVETFITNP